MEGEIIGGAPLAPPTPSASSREASGYDTGSSSDGGSGEAEADGEESCRICRCGSEPGRLLFHPCKCSGSIKYVHQDCLLQWLSHSGNSHCEVCKHEFQFTPVYADNAPHVLPFHDFLLGLSARLSAAGRLTGRVALVFVVWLVCLPQVTCVASRLAFSRTLEDAANRLDVRRSPLLVVSDCLLGSLLSAMIVTGFTIGTTVIDFFREYFAYHGAVRNERHRNLGGDPQLPADDAEPEAEDENLREAVHGPDNHNPAWAREEGLEMRQENWGRAGLGVPLIDANFDDVDHRDDPFGEVFIEDLIGLRGPVTHVLENAVMVTVFNVMVIVAAIGVPFNIGRIAIFAAGSVQDQLSLDLDDMEWLQKMTAANQTTMSADFQPEIITVASKAMPADSDVVSDTLVNLPAKGLLSLIISGSETLLADLQTQLTLPSEPDRNLLILGYSIVFSLFMLRLVTREIHRSGHHWRQGMRGVGFAIQIAGKIVSWLARSSLQALVITKVVAVLVAERGILPLLVGWWLDVCALPVTGATLQTRVEMMQEYPWSSAGMHWFLGLAYMLYMSTLVSIAKHSIVPEMLPRELEWLHIPAEDQPDFLHVLMEERLGHQLVRVVGTLVVYLTTLVWAVHFPVMTIASVLPRHFPFKQRFSNPTTEISVDVLLFHVLVPLTLEHIHGAGVMRAVHSIAHKWLRSLSVILGLQDIIAEVDNEPGLGGAPVVLAPVNAEPLDRQSDIAGGTCLERSGAGRRSRVLSIIQGTDKRVRVTAVVLNSGLLLMTLNGLLLVLPVSAGRALFSVFSLPLVHDMYAAILGCYILWAVQKSTSALWRTMYHQDLVAAARFTWHWSRVLLEAVFLFILLAGMLPLLLGILLELFILPIRVSPNKSPVLFLYQDWVLGLLCLKLWHRAVMVGQGAVDDQHDANPVLGGHGEGVLVNARMGWREKFLKLHRSGFNEDTMLFLWQAVATPLLLHVTTALALPYALSRAILPSLNVVPLRLLPYLQLYSYHITALAITLSMMLLRLKTWAMNLHNTIRDDRYLVGRQLNNFPHGTASADT